jgi:hypothetical protein
LNLDSCNRAVGRLNPNFLEITHERKNACDSSLYRHAGRSGRPVQAPANVCVASIPGDWSAPVAGTFVKETMNSLADVGEKLGADPASWSNEPPEF